MHLQVALFLITYYVIPSNSARILGIVPSPSYSHQIAFRPLWRELSLKEHEVVVLTTNPMKDPSLTNLTEIDLQSSYQIWNKFSMFDMSEMNIFELTHLGVKISNSLLDYQLQQPEVQKLLKNESEHFDLVMVEVLFPTMYTFAERFKCPFIEISSFDAPNFSYHIIGNPPHPVLDPDATMSFSEDLTFFERLLSASQSLFIKVYGFVYFYPSQNELIQKHFGNNFPPLEEIMKKVSMMFVNTNSLLHHIKPLVPAVVQFGGDTHLGSSQPLPQELQKTLDNASEGFIYFSLGSNVRSTDFSESSRNIILETFAELPYTILWKFEVQDLPGKPDNVIVSKWFPQQRILEHPNIKLFITQGGLQSMEEAVFNHVPMVGIPFFGDQPANIKRMVRKGVALYVDHKTLTKPEFKKTILEVINNPKYLKTTKELAELATDQPMSGLERAIWWTEYVLRHKGAKHLRSPAMDIPYYQYFLLDVIGFCLFIILAFIYLVLITFKMLFKLFRYYRSKPKVKLQ